MFSSRTHPHKPSDRALSRVHRMLLALAATAASASSIRCTRESARSDGLCGWVREENIYVEGLIEASVGPSSCQEECEYSDDFDRRAHVDDLPQTRHRCIAQPDAAV